MCLEIKLKRRGRDGLEMCRGNILTLGVKLRRNGSLCINAKHLKINFQTTTLQIRGRDLALKCLSMYTDCSITAVCCSTWI